MGGLRFPVDEDRVLWLGADSSWDLERSEPAPEIGDARGNAFYRLPLDQKKLIELFGEPDLLSTDLADLL